MTRHVLKNHEVQLAGSFQLNAEAAVKPKEPAHAQPGRARLAETGPGFALVEVTCSCGRATLVRCEYAAGEAPVPAGSGQEPQAGARGDMR